MNCSQKSTPYRLTRSLGQGSGDGVGHETAAQVEHRPAPHGCTGVEQSIGDETGHNGHQVRRGGFRRAG